MIIKKASNDGLTPNKSQRRPGAKQPSPVKKGKGYGKA